jgi:hypothetical protein
VNGAVSGREVTKPVLAPGETDQTRWLEPRQRRFANIAIQHRAGVTQIAKQEGNIKDAEFGSDRGKDHRRCKRHLKRTSDEILAHLQLATCFACGVHLDPEAATAIVLDVGSEFQRADAELGIPGIGDAYPQYLRLDRRIGTPAPKARTHSRRSGTRKEMPSSYRVTHVFPRGQSKIAAMHNRCSYGKKTDNAPAKTRGHATRSAAKLDKAVSWSGRRLRAGSERSPAAAVTDSALSR